VEEDDDWNKADEEDSWDPDFDEFDIPKSKTKKATGGAGKKGKDEDDLGLDDDFKEMDLFNDSDGFDDDDDY
jgi:sodium/potassium-transporting ATPase subunit alpha